MDTSQPLRPSPGPNKDNPEAVRLNVIRRRILARSGQVLFFSSVIIAFIALVALLLTVSNRAFGYVAEENNVNPTTLAAVPLDQLSQEELVKILQDHISRNVFRRLDREQPFVQRSKEDVLALVTERVVQPEVVETWGLFDSLFNRERIEAAVREEHPDATLSFRSWVSWSFLTSPMSSQAEVAGIRTAVLGSLMMILLTMVIAVPIGVGAAIYLEEYATKSRINQIIQTNIYNLAGVPSIIYGILGLAIFVRGLERFTSGATFGVTDSNGRTILSASLTMALLVLPLVIINAQEALKAVPYSFREASYGLGATKWQTIWHHVIPTALPGILTGTILAMSRAIGETAPLIVVGASTFIVSDPNSPFSKFTALPILIYNWTARPFETFRHIAAAAIIVLLALLVIMNLTAILLRNRFRQSY
ncbi:MAG: phosphate ABC transporter permease PstA [Chloroflexi bacterium]|nr:phosphate ABC transporter permease PstA [Chloroflexota bacterium]